MAAHYRQTLGRVTQFIHSGQFIESLRVKWCQNESTGVILNGVIRGKHGVVLS